MAGSEKVTGMLTKRATIRALHTEQEFQDAVQLQKDIWGFEDIELLPVRLFIVATKVGGQALGAFDGNRMVGFCLAIPGLKPGGGSYLHSHMMGVTPEYRDSGVGRQLKLKQREEALARGIDLIEWTFDPLEIKNAHLNMERLGAIVRRYVRNQYGTTTSHLHGGLPTDRCVAEWWITSPRVKAVMEGGPPAARPEIVERIPVPAEIAALRRSDPKRARQIQQEISSRFEEYFARGLAVVGVERSADGGAYLFGRWE
ncbi:MAG TPA: GNAT family N-acetyltransferase [Bryobacteraceae bacterium]|nr:GNAT family N-acetyltransferase [Bryobacteraceae bacterium]